ncbi:hypothetical protein Pint_29274 [Pistacia integerrima]|uniref:Uncharacterized protein n=1 Tax=Pistacia integerrima TaxID=434235 RepID=A0ACC0X194_9ROSI|nr:hypothetical protein Pint_29274 [Pistacia integerrima]
MITSPWENLEGLLNTKFVSDTGSSLEAFANDKMDASLCWKDIGWLRSITRLPILIKGVFTPEDAIKAVQVGVAGIIVSNHGGGQLDYTSATISFLEEVVHAVEGKIPILMDGGVRARNRCFQGLGSRWKSCFLLESQLTMAWLLRGSLERDVSSKC